MSSIVPTDSGQVTQGLPSKSPQPFFFKLDPTQSNDLKNFWKRLIDLIYSEGSNPIDPIDLELKSVIHESLDLEGNKIGQEKFKVALWNWIMMDDPDVMVTKFIRARKWDISLALKMLINCLKWRIENKIDELKENEQIKKQLKTGKTFVHGVDRNGSPIFRIFASRHKTSDQSAKDVEEFVLYSMESTRYFVVPPVEASTILVNLSGFGMSSMDWKVNNFMIKCLEAYYPETLNAQIIHNAPWIFQGIWKIITTMLDPVVKSKVTFTSSNQDLLKVIDKSVLLASEGGDSDWEWSIPDYSMDHDNKYLNDSETRSKELANRQRLTEIFIDTTRQWIAADSDQSNEVIQCRELLKLMLRAHYFKLMPYVKPLLVYHHQKTLDPAEPGVVRFQLNRQKDSESNQGSNPNCGNKENNAEYKTNELVIGKETARKALLQLIDETKNRFKDDGIQFPMIDFEI
ncbi:hypothetical protein O181_030166 [Austropuccinia psidii MF-1]|uniref:CRAL-TRIO domain-containing protein n=1 Tax=Austropuccinia psidii MF-1 TaxID=1389203 RepID=A0A9Q3H403_9BASI|nr:hypothetical protein [Austropuccinia psidii MF-1]